MNKLRSLILAYASFCCIVAMGQNSIVEREYWFDGKIETRAALADAVAEIDLSALSSGLHSITLRAKDGNGVWSSTVTKFFVIAPTTGPATEIAEREYWFDGKIETRAALTDAVAEIDLSALSSGLHSITLRAKDNNGVWSSTVTKFFVIAPTTGSATEIAEREYWFDGKIETRAALADAVAEIDLSALSSGLHSITLRAKDNNGVWSSTVTKFFFIAPTNVPATEIAEREYWFDGKIETRAALADAVAEIDLSALSSGLHSITLRAKDNNGVWSSTVTKCFIIAPTDDDAPATLTHYIYWFDDDNAAAQSGLLEGTEGVINVSIKKLSEGEHTINWAVGNSRGRWSAVATQAFSVTHLPLTEAMISLADNTFEYSAEAIEPEVTVVDGEEVLVLGEDYNLNFTDNLNAGTAKVSVAGTGFYKDAVDVDFTITKAPLTVTADDQTREAGQENPEFTLTYSGWKGDDDISVLTSVPTASTEANADSPVGDYEITVSGGESQNYEFRYICGTLSVVVPVGIQQLTADDYDDNDWFSVSGQRLHKRPTSPGVYIHRGSKVLIK